MKDLTPHLIENDQISLLHNLLDSELQESAPLAWKIAPTSCFTDAQGMRLCLDYHRIWQYLLVLGVTKSLRTDSDFLVNSFRDCLKRKRRCRILVSGAADYGTLSHILWAARLENVTPSVTVLDRCNTSLELNKWYSKRQGIIIKTIQMDALDYAADKPYSCICTHSFLGWFSPSDQSKLVRGWYENLENKGVVITTSRIRPGTLPAVRRHFDEQEIIKLKKSVALAAKRYQVIKTIDIKELLEAVYKYCKSRHRYSIATKDKIIELFEQAGFNMDSIFEGYDTDPSVNRPSGPIKGARNRINIIALKEKKP